MLRRRTDHPFLAPACGDPAGPAERGPVSPWLAWMPWMLASGFALCCVVLLGLAFSLRSQTQSAERRLEETLRQAAALRQQLASWQEESRTSATNFQGRLADFQRQVVQRTLEFERQKAAAEAALRAQAAQWTQEKAALERQLAARAADVQALQEALAKVLAENKERLGPLRIILLRPTAEAPPQAGGALVWDGPAERGLLQVDNLGPPPADRNHQLWLHDPQYPVPISAGVLPAASGTAVRFAFKPLFPIAQLSRVTLTVERSGGTDKPQGTVLLEGR